MLVDEGAGGIEPLEDDGLAFVVGERMRCALRVRQREIGRGLADERTGGMGERGGEDECEHEKWTGFMATTRVRARSPHRAFASASSTICSVSNSGNVIGSLGLPAG